MDIVSLIIGLPVLVFSAILHEIAHGFVADKFGDPTARLMGRLTLDPRRHIDPFLSVILPLLLIISHSPVIFGGAKPVPIDPYNLREGRKDIALVSLAGPLTNVILAVLGSAFFHLLVFVTPFLPHDMYTSIITSLLGKFFIIVATYNMLLAIFNLLPIPPLDGSKIFALILPEREAAAYLSLGQIGIFLLLILLAFPIGPFSLQGLISNLFVFASSLLQIPLGF